MKIIKKESVAELTLADAGGEEVLAFVQKKKVELDALCWARGLISLFDLAVNSVPESSQVPFEKDLMRYFVARVKNREEHTVVGGFNKEVF